MQPRIKAIHTDCPHCNSKFITGVDVSDIVSNLQQAKEVVKEKEVYRTPVWIAKDACANGSCTAKHHNPRYAIRVRKKCKNCGSWHPDKARACTYCTKQDPEDAWETFDDEELDEIGIPRPEGHDQHHHDHSHNNVDDNDGDEKQEG